MKAFQEGAGEAGEAIFYPHSRSAFILIRCMVLIVKLIGCARPIYKQFWM